MSFKELGKGAWEPLLTFHASLHKDAVHPPYPPLPYSWVESAPYAEKKILFGHLETVQVALDWLAIDPAFGYQQIANMLSLQQADGLIPGWVACVDGRLHTSKTSSAPPLWCVFVEDYFQQAKQIKTLEECYPKLCRQLRWFEQERSIGAGFYYLDVMDRVWESGVVEGIRFDSDESLQEGACLDATAHLHLLYSMAFLWAKRLNRQEECEWQERAEQLETFIQTKLFCPACHLFQDEWRVERQQAPCNSFESIWPLVSKAASPQQAHAYINEHLLNPRRFLTAHPLASVALEDPKHELRAWRGPACNALAYWAARGCYQYGRFAAARLLLEKAINATMENFAKTRSIWEYYHPAGILAEEDWEENMPIKNHLGNNPLLAMAGLWVECYNREVSHA